MLESGERNGIIEVKTYKMTIKYIIEKLNLQVYAGHDLLQNEVHGAYVSDLLSDVMGNAEEGQVWITLQSHMNVVAIASLKELSAILLVNSNKPEDKVVKKAEEEKIPILGTVEATFEISGKMFNVLNK